MMFSEDRVIVADSETCSMGIIETARDRATNEAIIERDRLEAFVAAGFTREEAVTLCAARIKASTEVPATVQANLRVTGHLNQDARPWDDLGGSRPWL